jgi:hypothetical protein
VGQGDQGRENGSGNDFKPGRDALIHSFIRIDDLEQFENENDNENQNEKQCLEQQLAAAN